MKVHRLVLAAAGIVALAVSASMSLDAQAHYHNWSEVHVYNINSTGYVYDAMADGRFVAGGFEDVHNHQTRYVNKNGYDTTVSGDTGLNISAIQGCYSRTLQPMYCYPWTY